jgi:hypothetical protein
MSAYFKFGRETSEEETVGERTFKERNWYWRE